MTRFDDAIHPRPLGGGAFETTLDTGYWVVAGPNGGYLASVILTAFTAVVDEPARQPRSLTVHYLNRPGEGDVRIDTTVERAGRSVTALSARVSQEGTPIAMAVAAFSMPRVGVEYQDAIAPLVLPPEQIPASLEDSGGRRLSDVASVRGWAGSPPEPPPAESSPAFSMRPPIQERLELRPALGALPFQADPERPQALIGGWCRPTEPRVADAAFLAMVTDAWPPSVFSREHEMRMFLGVPTVDLTVHFRRALPLPDAKADDWYLTTVRSRMAHDGFLEEDTDIYAADGRLLVQSRQLALGVLAS